MLYAVCFIIFCVLTAVIILLPRLAGTSISRNQIRAIYFNVIVLYIVLIWVLIRYTILR
jgi:hypothetical protein